MVTLSVVTKANILRVAIDQWIDLLLPFGDPGFESEYINCSLLFTSRKFFTLLLNEDTQRYGRQK